MIFGSIDVVLRNRLPPISHAKVGGKLPLSYKKKYETVYDVYFVIRF